jgi:hypothetical protein
VSEKLDKHKRFVQRRKQSGFVRVQLWVRVENVDKVKQYVKETNNESIKL